MFLTIHQIDARIAAANARVNGTPNAMVLQPLIGLDIDWLFLFDRPDSRQGVCGMPGLVVDADVHPSGEFKFKIAFNTDIPGIYTHADVEDAHFYGTTAANKMVFCSSGSVELIREIIERNNPPPDSGKQSPAQPTLADV
jgi:hypothetical protein